MHGVYRITRRDQHGQIVSRNEYRNTICTTGKATIARFLNGEISSVAPVYGAIGTGAPTAPLTTVDPSDTQLWAEVSQANTGRVQLAANSRATNVLTWDFFWTTSQGQPSGGTSVLTEAAVFLLASVTPGSGSLLSHVVISETKSVSETLTVEFSITIG